jgi:hypothetical protein
VTPDDDVLGFPRAMIDAVRRSRASVMVTAAAVLVMLAGALGLAATAAPAGAATWTPGGTNFGPASASVPVAPAAGTPLRNIDRDAGVSVKLSNGKSLWMFADTTLYLGSDVVYFSGRGTGAIAEATDRTVLSEPTVPYGFLQVPASELIEGGAVACPPGTADYYWPTSAVAIPLGGGRDRVLLYYVAVCGSSPDLLTYQAQSMGIAEYVYDANDPPSPTNPIVAHVKNGSLFPPMPGHGQPGVGYGAASLLRNGELFVYGCHYSPSFQSCRVAKTTPAAALATEGYRFWDGASWSDDDGDAVDLSMPNALVGIKGSAAWVAGLNKYVFVDNDYPNAQMAVRFANRPQGPWTAPTFVPLPDCGSRGCRAGELHSEMSDANTLTLSYYAEGMLPALRLVRVPVVVNPTGVVDAVSPSNPTTIGINGWALDPDTASSIPVAVYLDGVGIGWFTANLDRPDIAAAFPGYGSAHGFDIQLPAAPGTHQVCVYAINAGPGTINPLLSCRSATLLTGNPTGVIDRVEPATPTSINIAGWALDPDTASPIPVAVYLDGSITSWYLADLHRPDIAAAFPGYGAAHGYDITVPAGPGSHSVCVYAINSGAGTGNPPLGCRTVTLQTGNPIGVIDRVAWTGSASLNIVGWAIDPDTAAPIPVAVYLDGKGISWFPADLYRADLAAAFPAYGGRHAYNITIASPHGGHQVCVYAINQGNGTGNPLLRCVTVAPP